MLNVLEHREELVFSCDGVLYVTSNLIRVGTNDPNKPALYFEQKGRKAFVASIDPVGTLSITALSSAQLQELVATYKLSGQLDSIRKTSP